MTCVEFRFMVLKIELISILLLVAALVAMVARVLRMPYTVGLVLAGIALAVVPGAPQIHLTKELIFTAFLPPLIFEAAFYISWKDLRRDLPVVITLATLGVLLSAALTTAGMRFIAGWEWTAAIFFGVIIAATDPVSVIATFREAGVHGRLRLLVESESLLNDGTVAVAFFVALSAVAGDSFSILNIIRTFTLTVLGGVACGAVVAYVILLLARRTSDHLVEITLTTIAAYGSFLLAEHFHLSGVLATMTSGIMIGTLGSKGIISEKGREAVGAFWEYIAFVVNSLVFILIGMSEAHENFLNVLIPSIAAIFVVILGRAAVVYPCCAIFSRSRLKVDMPHQHILFWGGLRGALALALVLGLPADFPKADAIRTAAFAVVAFSVIVQGLTITPLLRKMGLLSQNGQK